MYGACRYQAQFSGFLENRIVSPGVIIKKIYEKQQETRRYR
jgi:hypothetical protein